MDNNDTQPQNDGQPSYPTPLHVQYGEYIAAPTSGVYVFPATFANCKMVFTGDDTVGKTSMMIKYTGGELSDEWKPVVFDSWADWVMVQQKSTCLSLWDTTGFAYQKVRPLGYPSTDIFMLCFSVVDRRTFDHLTSYWLPEMQFHAKNTPTFLVGTKADLRGTSKESTGCCKDGEHECPYFGAEIHPDEARDLAKAIGCIQYLECSALTDSQATITQNVFHPAMGWWIQQVEAHASGNKKGKCVVM